jgi:hypothetical protein
MNRISKLCAIAALPLFALGCATGGVKVDQPAADAAAAIVIRIPGTCLPLMPCANQTLSFARLKEGGGLIADEIHQTTVVRDDHYYLLNAKPGRYVAVAAAYARGMRTAASLGAGVSVTASRVFGENILFSEALVRQTQVEVRPGTLAVMGEFDFDIDGRMAFAPSAAAFLREADAVQAHYAKALDPEMESRGATSATKFYRGTFKSAQRDAEARRRLLEAAAAHIGAEGWAAQIARTPR